MIPTLPYLTSPYHIISYHTKASYDSPKALEDTLWKHFSEWGELENVNVIHRLSIAFPRYRLRTSAEFAKEAMSNQAMDHKEILSIRWAKDDPNPTARRAIDRADRDAVDAILEAKGIPNILLSSITRHSITHSSSG